ncbi:ATP-binding protein [Actinoplanes sp. L3-i22]|uniref:sensor histidine kinase n=1 Tax=Actinoplanes sp. L3-i22 TaxID=2836373 RepID=UPI001C76F6D9|nr:two-component sensor histidine kinase [Actinoplanes sp. L3-i22]
MRTRVRNAILLVVALSLMLFGLPLAIVLDQLVTSQALARLQRDATRAVAAVPDDFLGPGTSLRVPAGIAVYDARGDRLAGTGPARSALAAQAVDGHEHDGDDGADLAVVMPVISDTTVAGSVRAAVPLDRLRASSYRIWGLLAGLALLVIAVAILLARHSAARIARPFEMLTGAARGLGDGRYDLRLPRWGSTEADAAGDALRDSAAQIEELVRHEREFVRDASHQLRTPLAGLVLALDRPEPDVPAALSRARDLETTIADLVALRGRTGAGAGDPGRIAAEAVRRWHAPERPVLLRSDVDDLVTLSGPALRQSLDVLLDNAIRHGRGTVTVTVEPYGKSVLISVTDEGDGFTDGAPLGNGLTMVTGMVERVGGSLLIRRRGPHPRVALLVPFQSVSNR